MPPINPTNPSTPSQETDSPTAYSPNIQITDVDFVYRDNSVYPWVNNLLTDYHDYTNSTGEVITKLRSIMSGVQLNPNPLATNDTAYITYQYSGNTDEISYDGNLRLTDGNTGAAIPMATKWDMQSDYITWLKDNVDSLLALVRSGTIIPDDKLKQTLKNGQISLMQVIKVTQGKVLDSTGYDYYNNTNKERSGDFTANSASTDGYVVATITFSPIS